MFFHASLWLIKWGNLRNTYSFSHSNLQVSGRRMSSESGLSSSERLKPASRKGSRKLKLSESIASSLGSNLNRVGGAHDLTKMLLTDDYFSDVNPRSMRRLMNVVYITGTCQTMYWVAITLWLLYFDIVIFENLDEIPVTYTQKIY
jgi:hypothetical protein